MYYLYKEVFTWLEFTHFNEEGRAKMVDVSEKPETFRTAIAIQVYTVNQEIYDKIMTKRNEKGRCIGSCPSCGGHGSKKDMGYHPHVSSYFS